MEQMKGSVKKIKDKYNAIKELTKQQRKEMAEKDIKELGDLIKKSLLDWKLTREKDKKGKRTKKGLQATMSEKPLNEIDLIAGNKHAHATVHRKRKGS